MNQKLSMILVMRFRNLPILNLPQVITVLNRWEMEVREAPPVICVTTITAVRAANNNQANKAWVMPFQTRSMAIPISTSAVKTRPIHMGLHQAILIRRNRVRATQSTILITIAKPAQNTILQFDIAMLIMTLWRTRLQRHQLIAMTKLTTTEVWIDKTTTGREKALD